MKTKVSYKELDEIYDAMDALKKAGCWNFLDQYFSDLVVRAWRTDVDILLAYATTSLACKSHLPSRVQFINTCKHLHPDKELWKGLD